MFKQFHQIYIDIYPEIELRRPKTFSSHYSVPSRRCVRSVTGEEYLELWHFCKSHLPAAIPIEFLDTCKWGLITQHSSATGHFLWKFLCNNLLVRETEYIPLTNCISIYVLQSTCPFVTFSECLSGFKIKAFYTTGRNVIALSEFWLGCALRIERQTPFLTQKTSHWNCGILKCLTS